MIDLNKLVQFAQINNNEEYFNNTNDYLKSIFNNLPIHNKCFINPASLTNKQIYVFSDIHGDLLNFIYILLSSKIVNSPFERDIFNYIYELFKNPSVAIYKKFCNLLTTLVINKNILLFILGDIIDGRRSNKEVVDPLGINELIIHSIITNLKNNSNNSTILMTIGNHDLYCLLTVHNYEEYITTNSKLRHHINNNNIYKYIYRTILLNYFNMHNFSLFFKISNKCIFMHSSISKNAYNFDALVINYNTFINNINQFYLRNDIIENYHLYLLHNIHLLKNIIEYEALNNDNIPFIINRDLFKILYDKTSTCDNIKELLVANNIEMFIFGHCPSIHFKDKIKYCSNDYNCINLICKTHKKPLIALVDQALSSCFTDNKKFQLLKMSFCNNNFNNICKILIENEKCIKVKY